MQYIRAFHTAQLAGHNCFSSRPSELSLGCASAGEVTSPISISVWVGEAEESAPQFLSLHFSVTVDHSQSTLMRAHIFTVRQRLQSKVMLKVAGTLRNSLGRWSCLLQRINFVTKVSLLESCPRKSLRVAGTFLFSTFTRDWLN